MVLDDRDRDPSRMGGIHGPANARERAMNLRVLDPQSAGDIFVLDIDDYEGAAGVGHGGLLKVNRQKRCGSGRGRPDIASHADERPAIARATTVRQPTGQPSS